MSVVFGVLFQWSLVVIVWLWVAIGGSFWFDLQPFTAWWWLVGTVVCVLVMSAVAFTIGVRRSTRRMIEEVVQ